MNGIEDKQGEQEGICEGGDEQEAQLGLPAGQAWAFEGELALIEPEGRLDVPTTAIGEDNMPGILGGMDRIFSEEISGFATDAWASRDQTEWLMEIPVKDGYGNNADLAVATSAGIPEHALLP